MYFTAKQLQRYLRSRSNSESLSYSLHHMMPGVVRPAWLGYTSYSLEECRAILREVHRRIASRNIELVGNGLTKWLRPWDVAPEISRLNPQPGDFTVGVEVEMGFNSVAHAHEVAKKLIKMHYVTLDWEGGTFPIEATFPPFLYSKLSNRTQVVRYTSMLSGELSQYVSPHRGAYVGTHVNVGTPAMRNMARGRLGQANNVLEYLGDELHRRYFSRRPYGYGYRMGGATSVAQWIEWKLFLSTTDPRRLRGYIHTAVELTRLVTSGEPIDRVSVIRSLETGLRKEYKDGVVAGEGAGAGPATAEVEQIMNPQPVANAA